MTRFTRTFRGSAVAGALIAAALVVGCGRDNLLGVDRPDIIDPASLQSPDGAEGLRVGAIARLKGMTAGDESSWLFGGMLVDEWKSADTFIQRDETDQRQTTEQNSLITTAYRNIHRARIDAYQAIVALRKFKPKATNEIGEMWFVKGFSELQSALDFCNGQPFADVSSGSPQLGTPVTTAQAFTMALASFDSSLAALGTATDSMSNRVRYSAQVGRARALLGLGRMSDAGAAITGVPGNFAFNLTWPGTQGKEDNFIWTINVSSRRYTVQDSADSQGGRIPNAMPFISAKDPRVPTTKIANFGFDGVTPHMAQQVFPAFNSPVPVANGVDAQLIDAEARLAAGDPTWITVLNKLRAGPTSLGTVTVSGMAPLTDPGTPTARLQLLFRERAFWTFGRGERLGDLRRMVRVYKLDPAQVFPGQGAINPRTNAPYGTDMNLQVPQAERNNTKFGGCTDRNA